MNSDHENPRNLDPAQDHLTDALLAEHARLGKESDKELVANILLNTVDAPAEMPRYSAAPKPALSLADWAKVAAAVLVIASLGALVLHQFDSGPQSSAQVRQENTFHLVVEYIEPDKDSPKTPKADRKILVTSDRKTNQIIPITVGSPDASSGLNSFYIAEVDLSAPQTSFGSSIDQLPVRASFTLASNDTTTADSKIIYSGDVVLRHSEFELKADSLVMDKSGKSSADVPVFKALNARLSHRNGAYETEADAISYDPSSGELVAKGVQRLLRNGTEQPMRNEAAVVVFEHDQFTVQEVYARPQLETPGN